VKPPSKADRAAQAKAREAQKKRMDEALGHASSVDKPYVLGMQKPAARSSGKQLPEAMRQALQSVPDDPGSLLRKKFMLEYQRRMQRGDTQDNGQQDGSEGQ
jgi:Ca-activated chloride channel family protein